MVAGKRNANNPKLLIETFTQRYIDVSMFFSFFYEKKSLGFQALYFYIRETHLSVFHKKTAKQTSKHRCNSTSFDKKFRPNEWSLNVLMNSCQS